MKRHFVAKTKNIKYIGIFSIEDIAALLNANKIQEDFVATERNSYGPSYAKIMQSEDAKWVTIAQLLEAAYKDKPLITVILKDVENNKFLSSERYHSDDGPWKVALASAENYFDQHLKEFTKSPKEFLLYYKSDKCLPSVMTFKLKVECHTVYKGVMGSKYEPSEEISPYQFVDLSIPHTVEPPDEFPPVALELKPAKYNPTAPLPMGWRD